MLDKFAPKGPNRVPETEPVATRMPVAEARQFAEVCKKDGVTVAEAIRQLIRAFINQRG